MTEYVTVADGTRIAYATFGHRDAEPLLMIHGLGADGKGWILQRRTLAKRFRLVVVDNRGVGRSDKPEGPYDLEVMAADALAALDHAGYRSAHVIGASMGGIIAQVLAVRHPDRVRSLVLACTACQHFGWRKELLAEWREEAETVGMRTWVRNNLRWLMGPRSLRRTNSALAILGPLAFNVPVSSFVAQIDAILDVDDRLREDLVDVRVPTLVIVGSQDVLTTQGDGEEIADLIPGAELAVVRGGAHLFMVEMAKEFNHTVTDFLARVTAEPTTRTLQSQSPRPAS